MRCLRKVNILNRTDYKLMCCLLGYVATETRVGKNRRLARDPCFFVLMVIIGEEVDLKLI